MADRFVLIDPDGMPLSADIEAADFRRGKMVHHPKTGELVSYEDAGYKLGDRYPLDGTTYADSQKKEPAAARERKSDPPRLEATPD